MVIYANAPNLCLQNVVKKLEDRSSSSDTPPQHGHKPGSQKANRKGEVDKEKGKPAANSKSGSRQETVILNCSHKTPQHCQLPIVWYVYRICVNWDLSCCRNIFSLTTSWWLWLCSPGYWKAFRHIISAKYHFQITVPLSLLAGYSNCNYILLLHMKTFSWNRFSRIQNQ